MNSLGSEDDQTYEKQAILRCYISSVKQCEADKSTTGKYMFGYGTRTFILQLTVNQHYLTQSLFDLFGSYNCGYWTMVYPNANQKKTTTLRYMLNVTFWLCG